VRALRISRGNKARAARILRIDARRLDRKIRLHRIKIDRSRQDTAVVEQGSEELMELVAG
jgi:hypothetical protein